MKESAGAPRFPRIPEVITGDTADVYFVRTQEVLAALHRDPPVGMEIFPGRDCVCCGVEEARQLLSDAGFTGELWAVPEGESVSAGQSAMQIYGRYSAFGIYETAILGVLASGSGWCSAAREVVDAAGGVPVVSFGARHVHPNVAAAMDYAAIVGGCVTCSTPLGAALAGTRPSGTMPHALMLLVGDTVEAARAFDTTIASDVARIVLVDTFQDEAVESVRVAAALQDALGGVRLDTPRERGGVTSALVHEVRARLDLAGFGRVQIVISGGISPDRIRQFREAAAPVDSYGVGSYISGAAPVDYTGDIREVDGLPVAKRGRIPGMHRDPKTASRLRRLLP